MDNFKKLTKGFTLIEVLVTIVLIGLLAGAAIAVINPVTQIQKANDSRRKSDLAQIQRGLEMYFQDYGRYPENSASHLIIDPLKPPPGEVDWGTEWPPYMGITPRDPNSTSRYVYLNANSGQSYYLYANLEREGNDSQACPSGNPCSSAVTNGVGTACGVGVAKNCNYGVSTPDVEINP